MNHTDASAVGAAMSPCALPRLAAGLVATPGFTPCHRALADSLNQLGAADPDLIPSGTWRARSRFPAAW